MALTSNGVSAYYPVYTYAGLADNRQGVKKPRIDRCGPMSTPEGLPHAAHAGLRDAEEARHGRRSAYA